MKFIHPVVYLLLVRHHLHHHHHHDDRHKDFFHFEEIGWNFFLVKSKQTKLFFHFSEPSSSMIDPNTNDHPRSIVLLEPKNKYVRNAIFH
jgi:hypothetical protein